jgi:hypothetical protein
VMISSCTLEGDNLRTLGLPTINSQNELSNFHRAFEFKRASIYKTVNLKSAIQCSERLQMM